MAGSYDSFLTMCSASDGERERENDSRDGLGSKEVNQKGANQEGWSQERCELDRRLKHMTGGCSLGKRRHSGTHGPESEVEPQLCQPLTCTCLS